MSRALEPGSSISHYRVVSALGSGGMGEVYKAQDTTLGRVVALKILPPELTRNTDRVRRFVQEAKTASSLNHPHIVTIHEIGQATASTAADAPPLHYIAMELIDGLTLREKIHGDKTDLKTLLVYMGQVAEGMAKAHAAGIIHRDLKPDNVMITRDGYAKVLDFGLAKLNIRKGADAESSGTTETQQVTREGAVMGTVAYMSPEQVQGKVIDYRSDIFSFGCMLYEAATRRRPFEADSDMDVMYKIVHDAPPNIEEIDPTVPVELRHLIRRCVAKDPDKRFQWMKDVALELNDIVAEFDQLPTSVPSRTSPSISTPSAVIRAMPRRVAWTMLATGAAIVIAIIAAGVFLWKRAETATESAARARPMRMDRVTNSGDVSSACISGDGRYLAYTARDENLESRLIVRQVATGVDVTLVGPIREAILTPAFSPDGNYLLYRQTDQASGGVASLNRIAVLGGSPTKITQDVDTMVAFSPDGGRIAFGRGVFHKGENHILVANADGSNERVATAYRFASLVDLTPTNPCWSADGKKLIASIQSTAGGPHDALTEIDLTTGNKRLIGRRWAKIWGIARLPDDSALILAAAELENRRNQVWVQPLPDGVPRRVTNDLSDYFSEMSVTDGGEKLATIQANTASRLFVAPATDAAAGTPLTGELAAQRVTGISCSSSGRIVYTASSGPTDIWTVKHGEPPKRLTTDGSNSSRTFISADGSTIVFRSARNGGVPHVWRMASDGSNAQQLTNGSGETPLAISADAKTIAVRDIASGRITFEGPLQGVSMLPEGAAPTWFAISPDDRLLGAVYLLPSSPSNGEKAAFRLLVCPIAGGKPVLDIHAWGQNFEWTPGGDAITFTDVKKGARNLWKQPLDGAPPEQITHFKRGELQQYAWLNNSTIVYSHQNLTRDAILISDFK